MSFQLPAGFRPAAQPQGGNEEERAQAAQQATQREEMKRSMIQAMLETEARERLSRIALTRPQLASQVEDLLVRMGQQGQIRGKVTDEALKGLLEQVSAPAAPAKSSVPQSARTRSLGGITIQRKRDDSDSDEYDL